MNIQPLHDRVLVRPIEQEEVTPSGIILPETAKEKPMEGEVIAVGPGALQEDGSRRPLDVQVGDRVIYAKYAGTEIKNGDNKLLLLKESDILAKVVEG
ncbi:MAG: co-chaperone GroES [Ardenticatenia bacterium]|nr:co-chaperone GroES [Ardenticatenia bacterium]